MTATQTPPPARRRTNGRILKIVGGSLAVLFAIGLVGQMGKPATDQAATPAAAVATTAARPTEAPKATEAPKPTAVPTPKAKIGDQVGDKNWKIKVVGADRLKGDLQWSSLGNVEAPTGQWFVLTTEITNTTGDSAHLNSHDFKLKLADGRTVAPLDNGFTQSMYAQHIKQTPLNKAIAPGATVTVPLVFDIPADVQGIDLVYTWAQASPVNVG